MLPVLVIVFWAVISYSRPSVGLQPHPDSIFILAGQSNMAGRGGVINDTSTGVTTWDGVIPTESHSDPAILRLAANLTWVMAHEPLHKDIDYNKTNGVGPGMPFAHAILSVAKTEFGVIGLVPCAIGGTKIKEWERGTSLYDQMTRRAQAAVRGGGRIRALLWYQGETDAEEKADAEMYKRRLHRLFVDMTADLQLPGLPIIQVALASKVGPYTNTIRDAQLGLGMILPNVRTVDAMAMGLALEPGGLHLTTSSQVRLGETMADAFLDSFPKPIGLLGSSARRIKPSNFVFEFVWRLFRALLVLTI